MFKILFLLFIAMPILEIMLLMNVGAILGVWPTIGLVILTAWLGAGMVRQQGLATFQSVQAKLQQGETPSDEIIAALLLMVAGVLLLTPGFITDVFGLLILWPVSRSAFVRFLKKNMVVNSGAGFSHGFSHNFDQQGSSRHDDIEGEYTETHSSFHYTSIESQPSKESDDKTIDGEFEHKKD